jgi:hypothetical protein
VSQAKADEGIFTGYLQKSCVGTTCKFSLIDSTGEHGEQEVVPRTAEAVEELSRSRQGDVVSIYGTFDGKIHADRVVN